MPRAMTRIGPEEWLAAERRDRLASLSRARRLLVGVYAPAPFIVIPALASLPIMAVAGEGDFIISLMGAMWAALFVVAVRVRRNLEKGSLRRACATGTATLSLLLAVVMFAITAALISGGAWR